MKVAIVGSRSLAIKNLEQYLPPDTTEIFTGDRRGIDKCAREWATENNVKLNIIPVNFRRHRNKAPVIQRRKFRKKADFLIIFWDGQCGNTKELIDECRSLKKPVKIFTAANCNDIYKAPQYDCL